MQKKNKLTTLLIAIVIVVLFNLFSPSLFKENKEYHFANQKLLIEHFNKHGKEMGYATIEEYEKAANKIINNRSSLHKKEKEDNDDVYYLESENAFVIVSADGYIRTYFYPDAGKDYFDRQ